MTATATALSSLPLNLLIVDANSAAAEYPSLFNPNEFRVNVTPHVPVALEYMKRTLPPLVVTELALEDGSGLTVCSAAKALAVPATVLVTTTDPTAVPDALLAGCDGVLLKPFPPNLLIARISRLLRERSHQLRLQAARTLGRASHLSERVDLLKAGTNRTWPSTQCPYCAHAGVVSFDYASMRRAWYACLDCRKVWIARLRE